MAGGGGLLFQQLATAETNVYKKETGRQIFVPTNLGTNTFVFDTLSFLSILTLAVFLVRVFSRVIRCPPKNDKLVDLHKHQRKF